MYIKPEDRQIGKENFEAAISAEIAKDKDGKPLSDGKGNYYFNRREFLAGTVAAGVVSGGGLGAMYFGYGKTMPDPSASASSARVTKGASSSVRTTLST